METPGGKGRAQRRTRSAASGSTPPAAPQQIDFLKRRWARAIEKRDQHADILRQLLDRLINGKLAR
jgi:hypothetical protein